MRTLIIDYDAIVNHLHQEDRNESDRTWGPLDILLHNTKHALATIVNGNDASEKRSIAVDIDDESKSVTVFGESIDVDKTQLIVLAYLREKPLQEQLYEIFTGAEDRAKKNGRYDDFFSSL